MSSLSEIHVHTLGVISYTEAEQLQQKALEHALNTGEESVFLLQHSSTITFGKRGGQDSLKHSESYYTNSNIELIQSTRGGNITCHYPGQLVVYPIVKINKQRGGLKNFFASLEECVIQTLAHFSITASRKKTFPGVWIDNKKICSIGIGVKHWVTFHGLSLNILDSQSIFNTITPCGLSEVEATSMQAQLQADCPSFEAVQAQFLSTFCTYFTYRAKHV